MRRLGLSAVALGLTWKKMHDIPPSCKNQTLNTVVLGNPNRLYKVCSSCLLRYYGTQKNATHIMNISCNKLGGRYKRRDGKTVDGNSSLGNSRRS